MSAPKDSEQAASDNVANATSNPASTAIAVETSGTMNGPGSSLPAWQNSIPTIHKLHHSQAQRIVWALQELQDHNGLKWTIKTYERKAPRNEELLQISPMGKSPILTVDDLNGNPLPNVQIVDGILMESALILEYISQTYGGKEIWEPETDAEKRRDIYCRAFALNSLQDRIDQPLVLDIIPEILPFPMKQIMRLLFSPVLNALKNFQIDHYNHMESLLSDEQPFFAGKKLGISDFCMEFPVGIAISRRMLDVTKYPKIKAWYDRCHARKAFQSALEKSGGAAMYDLEFFGVKGQKLKL